MRLLRKPFNWRVHEQRKANGHDGETTGHPVPGMVDTTINPSTNNGICKGINEARRHEQQTYRRKVKPQLIRIQTWRKQIQRKRGKRERRPW